MGARIGQSEPVSIFISYAHEDTPACNALLSRLAALERDNLIRVWYDNHIRAGDAYGSEIDSRLRAADLILLLVSKAFLTSEYCCKVELRAALELSSTGTARIVPLILSPCNWIQAQFSHLQVVPRDGKTVDELGENGWQEVLDSIRRAIAIPGLEEFLAAQESRILQEAQAKIQARFDELTNWAKLAALLVKMRVLSGALADRSPEAAKEAERSRASGEADDHPEPLDSGALRDSIEPRRTLAWDDVIRQWTGQSWRGVLLGDPGFGKTTLLWRTVCEINARAIHSIREGREPATVAVYSTAGSVAGFLSNPTSGLDDPVRLIARFITGAREGGVPSAHPACRGWIENAVRNGRCLIAVDALDEIPAEQRATFMKRMRAHAESNVSFLFSARLASYLEEDIRIGYVTPSEQYEIREFDEEQIEQAIRLWFASKPEIASAFWDRLTRTPGFLPIRKSLRTPFLLRIACEVFGNNPEDIANWKRKSDLFESFLHQRLAHSASPREPSIYREFHDEFARKLAFELWMFDPGRNQWELSEESPLRAALRSVAAELREVGIHPLQILDELRVAGILASSNGRSPYYFVHRTVGEFLAAKAWARRLERDPAACDQLQDLITHRERRQTIVFLAGQLTQPQTISQLLEMLASPARDGLFRPGLSLAIHCAGEIHPDLAVKVSDSIEAVKTAAFAVLREVLPASGLPGWHAHVDLRSAVGSPILLPDLMASLDRPGHSFVNQLALVELGDMAAEGALLQHLCGLLASRELSGLDLIKASNAGEALARIGRRAATPAVVGAVLDRLRWLLPMIPANMRDILQLRKRLLDPRLQSYLQGKELIEVLGKMQSLVPAAEITALLQPLAVNTEHPLAVPALRALKRLNLQVIPEGGLPALIRVARGDDLEAKWRAVWMLGQVAGPEDTQLLEILSAEAKSEHPKLAIIAAEAVAHLRISADASHAESIFRSDLLRGSNVFIRRAAAGGLAKLKASPPLLSQDLVQYLGAALRSSTAEVRSAAVEILIRLRTGDAEDDLAKRIAFMAEDPQEKVDIRENALLCVTNFWANDPRLVPLLETALSDRDPGYRSMAAYLLGKVGRPAATPEVMSRLLSMLTHENNDKVRKGAAYAFSRFQKTGVHIPWPHTGSEPFSWRAVLTARIGLSKQVNTG